MLVEVPALDHVDDELVVKAPGGDLVAGLRDRVALILAEHPEFGIGQCRGLLDESERVDETREVAQRDSGDREVLHGAQRLHAEIRAPGNLAAAKQVAFCARRQQRPRSAHAERRVRQQPDTVGESLADACHDTVVGLRVLLADEIHCLAGACAPAGDVCGVAEDRALGDHRSLAEGCRGGVHRRAGRERSRLHPPR